MICCCSASQVKVQLAHQRTINHKMGGFHRELIAFRIGRCCSTLMPTRINNRRQVVGYLTASNKSAECLSIAGSNAPEFAISGTSCASILLSYRNCNVRFNFTPSVAGERYRDLWISGNGQGLAYHFARY